MKDAHVEVFIEEARELLAELETSLGAERGSNRRGACRQDIPALHTTKVPGRCSVFDEIADFTHGIENTDLVRSKNGRTPLD